MIIHVIILVIIQLNIIKIMYVPQDVQSHIIQIQIHSMMNHQHIFVFIVLIILLRYKVFKFVLVVMKTNSEKSHNHQ